MAILKYTCPKCQNREYETGEFRAAGGFWTKVFNIQNKKFTTVICTRCRYTEIYQADSNKLGSLFDFFVG
ncbi:MAG: GTP-binding protein [Planctomycetes bacterium]|nr:GTP-binding protein [Planctomycetota bacterium]